MTATKVKGLAEMHKTLQELPVRIERNILRSALAVGARVVAREVKLQAPKDTGELAKGVKVSTDTRGGRVIAKVKLTGPHAFIGPWLEFGTKAHKIVAKPGGFLLVGNQFVTSVDHPGIRPRPFMRPAAEQKREEAINAVALKIKQRMTKEGLATPDQVGVDEFTEDEGA
jgi:HK97 gp10 family phage protein